MSSFIDWDLVADMSMLGRVTPLGQPRSVYKSDFECPFLEFWVEMTKISLKVTVNDPQFQYQLRVSQDACLVQICWF